MAIVTSRNTGYGGPLVSQKYQPLMNIALDESDSDICSGLLTNRSAMLKAVGLLDELRLTVPNWAVITSIEAKPNRPPPLVVVSSARSDWVQYAVRAGKTWMDARSQPFANVSDLEALMDLNNHSFSPPLYAPYRVNDANRRVYMVVHEYEYATYKRALATLVNDGVLGPAVPILPVAFSFGRHADKDLLGFGASRFAAIEFCKSLRQRTISRNDGKATWNVAWIMDDTTVSLSKFAGFSAVEAALGDNAAAGFQVDTTLHGRDSNLKFAVQEFDDGRGGQATKLPALLSDKKKAEE